MARFRCQALILLTLASIVAKFVCVQTHVKFEEGIGDEEELFEAEAVQDASAGRLGGNETQMDQFPKSVIGRSLCRKCNYVTSYDVSHCKAASYWKDLSSEVTLTQSRRRNGGDDQGTDCVAPKLGNSGTVATSNVWWGLRINSEKASTSYPGACRCMQEFQSECNKDQYAGRQGECMQAHICGCSHVCVGFKQLLGCSGTLLETAENDSAFENSSAHYKAKQSVKESAFLVRAEVAPGGRSDIESHEAKLAEVSLDRSVDGKCA